MIPWLRRERPPGRDLLTARLEEALVQDDCAICRLVLDDQERGLWILLWENVNDPGVRSDLREGLGFCPEHTAVLCRIETRHIGGISGVAILFADFLAEAARRLEADRPLDVGRRCMQCRRDAEVANTYVDRLAHHLTDPSWACQWQAHAQLCLPHRRQLLASTASDAHHDSSGGVVRSDVERSQEQAAAGAAARHLAAAQDLLFGQRPLGERPPEPRLECPLCTAEAYEEQTFAAAMATGRLPGAPCRQHAAVVALRVQPVELMRAYAGVLESARQLPHPVRPGGRSWLRRPAQPLAPPLPVCPICVSVQRWRPLAAAGWWRSPAPASTADRQTLFCLPHLELLLVAAPDARARAALARGQAARLRALVAELGELLRKLDWNNRHEPRGTEQTSWIRAAHCLAGEVGTVRDLVRLQSEAPSTACGAQGG